MGPESMVDDTCAPLARSPLAVRRLEVLLVVEANLRADVVDLMVAALSLRPERLSVPRLAAVEGVGARALEYRCRRLGLPPPMRIVQWVRVLHAAAALERSACSNDTLVLPSAFCSRVALRRALGRCGLSVAYLCCPGGLRLALRELCAQFPRGGLG